LSGLVKKSRAEIASSISLVVVHLSTLRPRKDELVCAG
jgi:hypothetical protein